MSSPAASPAILGRFPAHLQAGQPGKLVGAVVDRLAVELEVATNELGGIRRSRRLDEATELADLLHLATLHGIEGHAVELLRQRLAAAQALARIAADRVAHLDADVFARLADVLGVPASAAGAPDARDRLIAGLAKLAEHRTMLELLRLRIATVVGLHRRGNGTVDALLRAAANAVDLDVEGVRHSGDRYWHVADCRDRLRLEATPDALAPIREQLVLEENRLVARSVGPDDVKHGEHVTVLQRGYDTVPVSVRVSGIGARTVAPMVVNLDTGVGIAFAGSLAGGQTLDYAPATTKVASKDVATTSAMLDAKTDVAQLCFSFEGGIFADEPLPYDEDFVFADDATMAAPGRANVARFAVSDPAGAFDAQPPFKRDAANARNGRLVALTMPAGAARWALFVGAGTFGADVASAPPMLATPLLFAARFDRSVFDPSAEPPAAKPVAKLGLSWREHEPFAAVVWLPGRFAALDSDGRTKVAARVSRLLERHRAAGVRVDVGYVDATLARRMPASLAKAANS